MTVYIYDTEVMQHDWLAVFKEFTEENYTIIWNDNAKLVDFLNKEDIYIGFNSKNYDQFILKASLLNCTPEEIKQVNDFIISGGNGWEYPGLNFNSCYFNNVDIRDDMQKGLSLKAIEGHLGLSIKETEIDFRKTEKLSEEERNQMERYCKSDVRATEKLVELRTDYLSNKIYIGKMAGLTEEQALQKTNAKLTALLLGAQKIERNDERDYHYPDNLKKEWIPKKVLDYFDLIHDENISNKELFRGSHYDFMIGNCPATVAFGGLHSGLKQYRFEEHDDWIVRNYDVSSYYPNLMVINDYLSRNVKDKTKFKEILDRRLEAKRKGDKKTANALKLVVNTCYGGTLNAYNDLYDPRQARAVCISGQLYLLELTEHLYKSIQDLIVVQCNTDGIMVQFRQQEYEQVQTILAEWQTRTGFNLEEDKIKKIYQKDVNNYLALMENGEIKRKGGYLTTGISKVGAFNINNNCPIVPKAIEEYLLNDVPVEDTINNCTDILQFQLIAKASSKYKEVFQEVNGEKIPAQKVNRVYASNDKTLGKLYKIKADNGQVAKISSLPEHCLIDNDNEAYIDDIDKTFYIEQAKKKIKDFIGERQMTEKPVEVEKTETKKPPARKPKMNVYQKLMQARIDFMNAGISKSGKNRTLAFKYFELNDIVPAAMTIFSQYGLIPLVSFSEEAATLTIVNMENPKETILFTSPNHFPDENRGTNKAQMVGAMETYQRRYLYMMALDICEPDSFDGTFQTPKEKEQDNVRQMPPVSPTERIELTKQMTDGDQEADEFELQSLADVMKNLYEARPDQKELIMKVAEQTKGFTVATKKVCSTLIQQANQLLKEEKSK